ncbi:hypothetical protein E2C01_067695 [Portunus trituberculatus]|uniref:Uncharacterized protein n=1 Tax=Portunus trituberculatus TaxID=210409 RepID=A0A5B7HXE8_PORTR|nr:hypothetical protein [Portunus trituberculatus]
MKKKLSVLQVEETHGDTSSVPPNTVQQTSSCDSRLWRQPKVTRIPALPAKLRQRKGAHAAGHRHPAASHPRQHENTHQHPTKFP